MKPETKSRNLAIVIDFMNADFSRDSAKRAKWAAYLLKLGLGLKRARQIQETVLAAHRSESVAPVAEGVREYVNVVVPHPSKDGRGFEILWDQPRADNILYLSLMKVMDDRRFWSLKRCPECSQFFSGRQKYWPRDCLRKRDIKKAQERVEKARAKKRFDQVFPKLLRIQKAAKATSQLELLAKLPGFNPKLLADIIEGKRPLKELAAEVKYKNRKILMEAKL